ncbi:MAG: OmpH family outer membrane protein [Pelosinus sp.]|nr:OmpH family outer membrane protein [Pelosinus sp.]
MVRLGERLVQFRIIIMAMVLFIGVAGLSSNAFAAAANNNTIGVVDFQLLMNQHPDMAGAQHSLKAELDQAQKDYNEKSQTMTTDEEKSAYQSQLQQRLNEKKDMLFGSIQEKVIAVIKEVADAKGMTIVVDKSAAIYGGQDITNDVGKKFAAK